MVETGQMADDFIDLPDQLFKGSVLPQFAVHAQPDVFAIEQVFMARNADSALRLGQARGSAIVAAVNADLPVYEYAARLIKQAVVGTGGAELETRMSFAVEKYMGAPQELPFD